MSAPFSHDGCPNGRPWIITGAAWPWTGLLKETDRKLAEFGGWLGVNHASHVSCVFIELVGVRSGPDSYRWPRLRHGQLKWARSLLMLFAPYTIMATSSK